MPFSFLVSPIYLDDIAQALECMERKTYWQSERQSPKRIIPVEELSKIRDILIEKIEIFENEKDCAGRQYTRYQIYLFSVALTLLNQRRHHIINYYQKKQYQNIDRNKIHVKVDACSQKKNPPESMRYAKVQYHYYREKY